MTREEQIYAVHYLMSIIQLRDNREELGLTSAQCEYVRSQVDMGLKENAVYLKYVTWRVLGTIADYFITYRSEGGRIRAKEFQFYKKVWGREFSEMGFDDKSLDRVIDFLNQNGVESLWGEFPKHFIYDEKGGY